MESPWLVRCAANLLHAISYLSGIKGHCSSARWEETRARWNKGRICWQHWCVYLDNLGSSAYSVAVELFYDRGHHHEFLSLSQELAAPGEMRQAQTFDFSFKNVEKQYESYQGINVKLRCVNHLQRRVSCLAGPNIGISCVSRFREE